MPPPDVGHMSLATTAAAVVADAALGIWLGSMVFFSFLGAPRVFAVLDREMAGRVVNDIFPAYYVLGVALGTVAFLAALARGVLETFGFALGLLAGGAVLGVVLAAYARWVLIPKMDAAGDDAFERYHRQSVLLNAATMFAVAAALVASHLV